MSTLKRASLHTGPDPSRWIPFMLVLISLFLASTLTIWLGLSHWGMAQSVPLDGSRMASLEVGELVRFEGRIGTISETLDKQLMYGCPIEGEDSRAEEGSYLVDPFLLRGPELSITVQLEEGCPNLKGSTFVEDNSWRGYRAGQTLSIVGKVRTLEPLIVDASQHYGGRQGIQMSRLWGETMSSLAVTLVFFLAGTGWLYLSRTHFREPWGWEDMARAQSLQYSRHHYWTPGRIEGAVDGRQVSISRRIGIGNRVHLHPSTELSLQLNPCMEPYRMRQRYRIETLIGLNRSDDDPEDKELVSNFVFKGVDKSRWNALLAAPRVRELLLELHDHEFSVELEDGRLVLHWPGLHAKIIDPVMPLAQDLANRLESAEAASWRQVAEALELDFEHRPERWVLQAPSETGARLVYARSDGRGLLQATDWTSSFESHRIARSIEEGSTSARCMDWQIEPRDPANPGQRTGDPVLDAHLSFRGFEEVDLQQLVGLEDATPSLMAALVAHGARLEHGCIKMERPGLVAEPQALFEDIAHLEDLLLLAVG